MLIPSSFRSKAFSHQQEILQALVDPCRDLNTGVHVNVFGNQGVVAVLGKQLVKFFHKLVNVSRCCRQCASGVVPDKLHDFWGLFKQT